MICKHFSRFRSLVPAQRRLCIGATRAPMHPQELMYKDGALGHRGGHRGGHGARLMDFGRLQWRHRISYRICL